MDRCLIYLISGFLICTAVVCLDSIIHENDLPGDIFHCTLYELNDCFIDSFPWTFFCIVFVLIEHKYCFTLILMFYLSSLINFDIFAVTSFIPSFIVYCRLPI